MMHRFALRSTVAAIAAAFVLASPASAAQFEASRIYIEYNQTDNDLGFHVFLDAEDWTAVKIVDPDGATIFNVAGKAGYKDLGLSELFFEGAEPTLDDYPLADLLALFPEGRYKFVGTTVDGRRLQSWATLSHAVPNGPSVSSEVNGDTVTIRWSQRPSPPAGFPSRTVDIVGYQVIVDSFQVTLPAWASEVTLPVVFVQSLSKGEHGYEVLAIDASGNQTITAGTFETK